MLYEKKQCARCPRADEVSLTMEQVIARAHAPSQATVPAVSISLDGQNVVSFQHLCAECTELVSKHITAIARQPEKASSTREKKEKSAKD
jgi:hypothetical protein